MVSCSRYHGTAAGPGGVERCLLGSLASIWRDQVLNDIDEISGRFPMKSLVKKPAVLIDEMQKCESVYNLLALVLKLVADDIQKEPRADRDAAALTEARCQQLKKAQEEGFTSCSTKELTNAIAALFGIFDTKSAGFITLEDVTCVVRARLVKNPPFLALLREDMRATFVSTYDVMCKQIFEELDTDKDGKLCMEDLTQHSTAEELVAHLELQILDPHRLEAGDSVEVDTDSLGSSMIQVFSKIMCHVLVDLNHGMHDHACNQEDPGETATENMTVPSVASDASLAATSPSVGSLSLLERITQLEIATLPSGEAEGRSAVVRIGVLEDALGVSTEGTLPMKVRALEQAMGMYT